MKLRWARWASIHSDSWVLIGEEIVKVDERLLISNPASTFESGCSLGSRRTLIDYSASRFLPVFRRHMNYLSKSQDVYCSIGT